MPGIGTIPRRLMPNATASASQIHNMPATGGMPCAKCSRNTGASHAASGVIQRPKPRSCMAVPSNSQMRRTPVTVLVVGMTRAAGYRSA